MFGTGTDAASHGLTDSPLQIDVVKSRSIVIYLHEINLKLKKI